MRAGRLYHKVSIQVRSDAQDAGGQELDTWTTLATRRASIEPITSREFLQSSGEHSDVTTEIRLRYDSTVGAVKHSDRILHGSVEYDIESIINPRERNRELILLCKRAGS